MTFDSFRDHGQPTYYSAYAHLPWTADLVISGLFFCFAILLFSFGLLIPGIAGTKEKCFFFLRVFISLSIGASILVTNFAMTWETAETTTSTKYKAGTGQEVNATIGVNIGLRGVNITLKADEHELKGETIDYNEKFSWEGLQGRLGFGPFAGRFNQEYRAAQFKGLPLPILWVAEYFTLDGEGIRWGRHYRQAGYYAHVTLWLAFPLWVMTNILFFVLIRYGACFMILTGLSMVVSNIIWVTHRNTLDLRIPFSEQHALDFSYGPAFWICLATGILCIFMGCVVFVMNLRTPRAISSFFGVDVLQDSEQIVVEDEPDLTVVNDMRAYSNMAFEGEGGAGSIPVSPADNDDDIYEDNQNLPPPPPPGSDDDIYSTPQSMYGGYSKNPVKPLSIIGMERPDGRSFKSAQHRHTKRFQRPRRKERPSEYSTMSTTPRTSATPTSVAINLETYRGDEEETGGGGGGGDNDYEYSSSSRL